MKNEYTIVINEKISLKLPVVHTSDISYYSFNLLGMTSLNRLLGEHLYQLIRQSTQNYTIDAIVTVESKAIGLAQVLSELLDINKCVVIRKTCKSYMKKPITYQSHSIISGEGTYWIDEDEIISLKNKNVLVLDDVISTGGTMKAVFSLLEIVFIKPKLIACVLTEGIKWQTYDGVHVISCGHIPIKERNKVND